MPRQPHRHRFFRIALAVVLAAFMAAVVWRHHDYDIGALQASVQLYGWWGWLAFILIYAMCAPIGVPGLALTVAGGLLFGPLWGTLYNLTGATLGAVLAFLAARYIGGDWVGGRFKRVVAGIESEGWRFVLFMRLVPLFPYNLLNYALGLTRIPLAHYALASLVGMAPGAAAYTYLGHVGGELAAGDERAVRHGLIGLGVLAAAVFIPLFIRRWHGQRPPTGLAPPPPPCPPT